MAKRVSTQRISKNRQYSYDQAAEVLAVTPQTVRSWRPLGLMVLTNTKPHYILGEALIEFLKDRQQKHAVKMSADELMCFSCRKPRRPLGMAVDYIPINDTRGRLAALCEVCEKPCQRFASEASLSSLSQIFEIATRTDKQA